MSDLGTQIAAVDDLDAQAEAEKRAALWLQGEQAFALWHQSGGSSPMGRAISRVRLIAATTLGADPVVMIVRWLDATAAQARKEAGAYLNLRGEATPAEVLAALNAQMISRGLSDAS